MADTLIHVTTKKPVGVHEKIKDVTGKEWVFSFATKVGLHGRAAEIYVRRIHDGKVNHLKPALAFNIGFFPDYEIV